MSTDDPEPEINFDGSFDPEDVVAMLRMVSPDGGTVVELDPAYDRMKIYGLLLDRQGKRGGPV